MPDAPAVLERATRISRTVFAVTAFVAVAALLVLARGGAGSGDGWSAIPGRRLFVVTSGSMSPTIKVGDAVIVKPIDPPRAGSLSSGDVVTFRAANNPRFLITHRIVAVRTSAGGRKFYETKGDANASPDASSLEPSRVVGVVTRVVPRLGSVLVGLQTPGVLVTFLAAFLLFEFSFVAFRAASLGTRGDRRRAVRVGDSTTQPFSE